MSGKTKFSLFFAILTGMLIGVMLFSDIQITLQPKSSNAENSNNSQNNQNTQPPGQLKSLQDLNNAFVSLAEQTRPSVVTVFTEKTIERRVVNPFDFFGFKDFFNQPENQKQPETRKDIRQGLGSGVVVSDEGYILTNNHVIDKADKIFVRTFDDRRLEAKVVGADAKTDIAVIKIDDSKLRPLSFGNSDKIRVGEWVIAIGSPLGDNLEQTVTHGIVSAKGRSNLGLADYEDFIQTDAAINPGNSGGPLVDIEGKLIGINTAIASRTGGFQGIGFAVPSNMAKQVMNSLIKYGKVTRGWLGVTIQDINESMAEGMNLNSTDGTIVGSVVEGSPAEKAGLKTGDVIIKLNGQNVKNTVELRNNIASTPPNTTVTLQVIREGMQKTIRIKLGELPSDEKLAGPASTKIEEVFGFSVANNNASYAQQFNLKSTTGLIIVKIGPSSNAYRNGLRTGDLILQLNKQDVTSIAEFKSDLNKLKEGENILFLIERRGSKMFVAFTK
jgi:serine protease Do